MRDFSPCLLPASVPWIGVTSVPSSRILRRRFWYCGSGVRSEKGFICSSILFLFDPFVNFENEWVGMFLVKGVSFCGCNPPLALIEFREKDVCWYRSVYKGQIHLVRVWQSKLVDLRTADDENLRIDSTIISFGFFESCFDRANDHASWGCIVGVACHHNNLPFRSWA